MSKSPRFADPGLGIYYYLKSKQNEMQTLKFYLFFNEDKLRVIRAGTAHSTRGIRAPIPEYL